MHAIAEKFGEIHPADATGYVNCATAYTAQIARDSVRILAAPSTCTSASMAI